MCHDSIPANTAIATQTDVKCNGYHYMNLTGFCMVKHDSLGNVAGNNYVAWHMF